MSDEEPKAKAEDEDVKEEETVEEKDTPEEEIDTDEESDKYPFPMARVVRRMKENIDGKMISSKVKVAMNEFLGEIASQIAQEMDKTRYSMVEMDDFQRATKPYTAARDLEDEKIRVIKRLEAMKADIEALQREFERKFGLEKEKEQGPSKFVESE